MRAFGLLLLLSSLSFSGPVLAQTVSPVPTSMPDESSPPSPAQQDTFDVASAKKELAAVDYKDCGKGGAGKILVTLSTDGTVERVVVAEGSWQPEVAICVTRRFAEIKVAPFTGASHTVKYAVALEGAPAAPTPTYSAPPASPPMYNPYMGPRGKVIDADDGPAPPGYHMEERRRSGALITGSIIGGMGLILGYLAVEEDGRYNSSASSFTVFAILHLAVGIPLFCVGLGSKKVFVADRVSLVPTINRTGGSAALTISF